MMSIRLFIFFPLLLSAWLPVHADSHTSTPLTLAVPLQPSSALVHFSISNTLFEKNSLDVEPSYFISGREALRSITADYTPDIVLASDIAFVSKAQELRDYKIVAHIFESDNVNRIISLAKNPDALKHGTLCTQQNSALHFFGSMVLQRLSIKNTQVMFFSLSELVDALGSGVCDAVTLRSPFIDIADSLYDIDIFEMPGAYVQRELVLAHNKVTDQTVKNVLLALVQAEKLVREDKDVAVEEIARAIEAHPETVKDVLSTSVLRVELEQMMLPMLDLQMSWLQSVQDDYVPNIQSIQMLRDRPINVFFPERNTVVRYD